MSINIRTYSMIRANKAMLNGKICFEAEPDTATSTFLSALYRSLGINYAKFFKMDNLCKAGFLASELLLKDFTDREKNKEDMAIVLWNKSSSLDTDVRFQKTIESADNYYPSPSEFVYTLPNIVIGEIAIRNKITGETAFCISENFDSEALFHYISYLFRQPDVNCVLCGWTEYFQANCEVVMYLLEKDNDKYPEITVESITEIYNINKISR